MTDLRPAACLSVDLDPLWCYREIYGRPAGDPGAPDAAYEIGVRRLLDFVDELGIPTTLFVIGQDIEIDAHRGILAEALAAGHELASHSYAHDYALRRRDRHDIRADLRRAHESLTELRGDPPTGFRTPGYNVDPTILSICAELGYEYDSSVFPCPPYWTAKALVMAGLAAAGRPSRSDRTRVDTLFAPLTPYRPNATWIAREDPTSHLPLEIPMCVLPGVRLPVIGTYLNVVGASGFAALFPLLRRTHPRLLNLEFHAIDFMDASDPGVEDLVDVQRDLRTPWATKRATYRAVIERASTRYRFTTLADAARGLASPPRPQ